MQLKFNCFDPADPRRPYKKQVQFLNIDRSQPGTTYSHWVGGRGSAKTTTGILVACMAALVWCPGLPGLWTEPTFRACQDIFLAMWRTIVPSHLYKINLSQMTINFINGSIIYVRSRNVDNKQREVIKGVNLAWSIDDEAAYKFDKQKFDDIDNAIRINTPYLFHDTLSTPKLDTGYYELCHTKGHNLIHATSFDNPFLPPGWAERQAARLSGQYLKQEIYGEWVPLQGLLWPDWKEAIWPNGNIHPHKHDHNRPYTLAFDLGVATSAWVILQQVQTPAYLVWVVTAQYTPKRDGSIDTVLRQIAKDYGRPSRVVAGTDIHVRESGSGEEHSFYVSNHFGPVPIASPSGWSKNKELQHSQLSNMILAKATGRRRICVSQHLVDHTPYVEPKRGIHEVMKMDAWPDESERRRIGLSAALSDGIREHMRDALMYFAIEIGDRPSYTINPHKRWRGNN